MIDDMPSDEGTNGGREPGDGGSTDNLELRLPPKPEFSLLVRATTGVIAGGLDFRYDEIVQLRTAAAEAFELTVRYSEHSPGISGTDNLSIHFIITPDKLEILFLTPEVAGSTINSQEQAESEALLRSLMDEVDLRTGTPDRPSIRLTKYRARAEG